MSKKGIICLVAAIAAVIIVIVACILIFSKGKAPSESWLKDNMPDDIKEYTVHVDVSSHTDKMTADVTEVKILKEKTSKDENIQECEVTLVDEYAKRIEHLEIRTKPMDGGDYDITSYTALEKEQFTMTPKLVELGANQIIKDIGYKLRKPVVKIDGMKATATYNANIQEEYYTVEGVAKYTNYLSHDDEGDSFGSDFPRHYNWTSSGEEAFDAKSLRCTLNIDGKWKGVVDSSYKVNITFKNKGGYDYNWSGTCDKEKAKDTTTFEVEAIDDGRTYSNKEMLVCAPDKVEFSGFCSFGYNEYIIYIKKDRAEIANNGFFNNERYPFERVD